MTAIATSRKRRRRRSTPTPAQIWRIFHVAAREARLAKREHAALLSRLDRELAAQRRKHEAEATALARALACPAADRNAPGAPEAGRTQRVATLRAMRFFNMEGPLSA